jgi:hypothetical protein
MPSFVQLGYSTHNSSRKTVVRTPASRKTPCHKSTFYIKIWMLPSRIKVCVGRTHTHTQHAEDNSALHTVKFLVPAAWSLYLFCNYLNSINSYNFWTTSPEHKKIVILNLFHVLLVFSCSFIYAHNNILKLPAV